MKRRLALLVMLVAAAGLADERSSEEFAGRQKQGTIPNSSGSDRDAVVAQAAVTGKDPAASGEAASPSAARDITPKPIVQKEPVADELSGTIELADGSVEAGVQVGLSTADNLLELTGTKFRVRQAEPNVVMTDKTGRFRFVRYPTGPFVLVAIHDTGFAEIGSSDFKQFSIIKLQPWGRIEGRALKGRSPDSGVKINANRIPPLDKAWKPERTAFVRVQLESTAGLNGDFAIHEVPPGDYVATRGVFIPFLPGQPHGGGRSFYCWNTSVSVLSGQASKVQIGGTGRPVTGKLKRDAASRVSVDWSGAREPVLLEKWDSAQGTRAKEFQIYAAVIESTGAFSVPDVPSGEYRFTAPVPGTQRTNSQTLISQNGSIQFHFTVPSLPDEIKDEPFSLGDIEAFVNDPPRMGDAAPEWKIANLRDGFVELNGYRDKLLLLDFWSPDNLASADFIKSRRRFYQQFQHDPRFAMVGIVCHDNLSLARAFADTHGLDWPQGYVPGTHARVARQYGIRSLPASFLISPEGTLLSKDLDSEALLSVITAALRDDHLFVKSNDKKQPRYPVLRYAAELGKLVTRSEPGVLVLDCPRERPADSTPQRYSVRLMSARGETIWERTRTNLSPTAGYHLVVDRPRNRFYNTEETFGRLICRDLDGNCLWHLEQINVLDLAVDEKTGNLWCCCGQYQGSSETAVFDPQGIQLANYSHWAGHIVYDGYSDAFWLLSGSLTKVDRNGKVLFNKKLTPGNCSSLSVNPSNGQVWVVERGFGDKEAKNRLWLFNSDGTVHRQWDFGEELIIRVAAIPNSNDAWIGFVGNGGIRRVSKDGAMGDLIPMWVTQFSIRPSDGDVWVATDDAVQQLDTQGKVLVRLPFAKQSLSPQAWLQAF